jgi:hypothetical protein
MATSLPTGKNRAYLLLVGLLDEDVNFQRGKIGPLSMISNEIYAALPE